MHFRTPLCVGPLIRFLPPTPPPPALMRTPSDAKTAKEIMNEGRANKQNDKLTSELINAPTDDKDKPQKIRNETSVARQIYWHVSTHCHTKNQRNNASCMERAVGIGQQQQLCCYTFVHPPATRR